MANRTVSWETVHFVQVVDEKGRVDGHLDPAVSDKLLRSLFERLVLADALAEKKFPAKETENRFKSERIGPLGFVCAGICLGKTDVVCGQDSGLLVGAGFGLNEILSQPVENGEPKTSRPRVLSFGNQNNGFLTGVGAAIGLRLRNEQAAVLMQASDLAGQGAAFDESLRIAGSLALPIVFVVGSGPNQTGSKNVFSAKAALAQKALSNNFAGIQADANDPVAILKVTMEGLDRGRSGRGPTLIELVSQGNPKEKNKSGSHEELNRLRRFLKFKKTWSQAWEDNVGRTVRSRAQKAIQKQEAASHGAGLQ